MYGEMDERRPKGYLRDNDLGETLEQRRKPCSSLQQHKRGFKTRAKFFCAYIRCCAGARDPRILVSCPDSFGRSGKRSPSDARLATYDFPGTINFNNAVPC